MVDIEGRKILALAIKQLVDGKIYTDAFYLFNFGKNEDRAIFEIWTFGCTLFHDFYPYRLKGMHKLAPEIRGKVERCLLFLNSKLEYEWLTRSNHIQLFFVLGAILSIISIFLNSFAIKISLFTCGSVMTVLSWIWDKKCEKRLNCHSQQEGEKEVWPFFTRIDYENHHRQ